MKKVLSYIFKQWKIVDYIFLAISIVAVSVLTTKLHLPAEYAVFGVLFVLGTIVTFKNYTLGYVLALGILGFYCLFLNRVHLMGDLILTAGILMPLLVYKIFALYFKKLNEFSELGKWDYIILTALILLSAYPIYLLMISMEGYMPIVECINIIIMCVLAFLQIRNYKFSKYLYLIITSLQLLMFIFSMFEIDTISACILVGLVISIILQIVYLLTDVIKIIKQRKNKEAQINKEINN